MSTPNNLAAVVQAEECAGSMAIPFPDQTIRDGNVIVTTKPNGDWSAHCTRCEAGCGAAGVSTPGDELDTDALDDEHRMLDDFTEAHRTCISTIGDDKPLPSPSAMPSETDRAKTTWVVKQASGGDLRVHAQFHTTYARPEGTELRFYNQLAGDDRHRVATVRAGSWHWCVAESALEPKAEES